MRLPTPRTLSATTMAVLACAALAAPNANAEPDETELAAVPQFCARAQIQTANLRIGVFHRRGGELSEVPYTDSAAFAASKPQVRPLTVTSYTTTADGLPKQVRCKGKSADHLTAEYGPGVAGPEGGCAEVTRRTLRLVSRTLTRPQRENAAFPPHKIVVDADTAASSGPDWLADFPVATRDAAGVLHLPSKSLVVPLDTPNIPEAFKGQHYCTLITPEYLKALITGAVSP